MVGWHIDRFLWMQIMLNPTGTRQKLALVKLLFYWYFNTRFSRILLKSGPENVQCDVAWSNVQFSVTFCNNCHYLDSLNLGWIAFYLGAVLKKFSKLLTNQPSTFFFFGIISCGSYRLSTCFRSKTRAYSPGWVTSAQWNWAYTGLFIWSTEESEQSELPRPLYLLDH